MIAGVFGLMNELASHTDNSEGLKYINLEHLKLQVINFSQYKAKLILIAKNKIAESNLLQYTTKVQILLDKIINKGNFDIHNSLEIRDELFLKIWNALYN